MVAWHNFTSALDGMKDESLAHERHGLVNRQNPIYDFQPSGTKTRSSFLAVVDKEVEDEFQHRLQLIEEHTTSIHTSTKI